MVYRQLNLLWGVKPVMIQKERTTDALFEEAVFKAKQAGLVKTGDTVEMCIRDREKGCPVKAGPQRIGSSNCLAKTQVYAKPKGEMCIRDRQ